MAWRWLLGCAAPQGAVDSCYRAFLTYARVISSLDFPRQTADCVRDCPPSCVRRPGFVPDPVVIGPNTKSFSVQCSVCWVGSEFGVSDDVDASVPHAEPLALMPRTKTRCRLTEEPTMADTIKKKEFTFAERVEVVQSLADHLEKATRYFQAGHAVSARPHLDLARHERARLGSLRSNAKEMMPTTEGEVAAMREVKHHTTRITALTEELGKWFGALPSMDPTADPDLEWMHEFIDRALPLSWDQELDLVVLVGTGAAKTASVFRERGYARVLVFAPKSAPVVKNIPAGVHVYESYERLDAFYKMIGQHAPSRVQVYSWGDLPAGFDITAMRSKLESDFREWAVRFGTMRNFGGQWVQQTLRNLHALVSAPSLGDMQVSFAGKPCVIICPGPSLEKNIEQVKALKGKAVLIAVNHALHTVKNAGLTPDFVVAADPAAGLRDHFGDLDLSEISGVVLGASVHESLYDLPSAKQYITYSANLSAEAWLADFGIELPRLANGGTVSQVAFSLGLHWGCDPVVLVGQDLAFTNGNTYASGTLGDDAKVEEGPDGKMKHPHNQTLLQPVKGWNGEEVFSSVQFDVYRAWYEQFMRTPPPTRIVNCTEGGAFIEGMEHLPLRDVAHGFTEEFEVADVLREALKDFAPARRAAQALPILNRRVQAYESIERIAKRCARQAEQAVQRPAAAAAWRQGDQEFRRAIQLGELLVYLNAEMHQLDSLMRNLRDSQAKVEASVKIYQRFSEAARTLRQECQHARDRIRAQLS